MVSSESKKRLDLFRWLGMAREELFDVFPCGGVGLRWLQVALFISFPSEEK